MIFFYFPAFVVQLCLFPFLISDNDKSYYDTIPSQTPAMAAPKCAFKSTKTIKSLFTFIAFFSMNLALVKPIPFFDFRKASQTASFKSAVRHFDFKSLIFKFFKLIILIIIIIIIFQLNFLLQWSEGVLQSFEFKKIPEVVEKKQKESNSMSQNNNDCNIS